MSGTVEGVRGRGGSSPPRPVPYVISAAGISRPSMQRRGPSLRRPSGGGRFCLWKVTRREAALLIRRSRATDTQDEESYREGTATSFSRHRPASGGLRQKSVRPEQI
jgi:hypothetical protein